MSSQNIEILKVFCRELPEVTEDIKWETNLVFSVADKMFAVFNHPAGTPFGCKIHQDLFPVLIEQDGIIPAPYLARHHWISIVDHQRFSEETLRQFLEDSYRLVVAKLPVKKRPAGY